MSAGALADSYADQIDAHRSAFRDDRSRREIDGLIRALRERNAEGVRAFAIRIDGYEAWAFVPSDTGGRRIVGPLVSLSRRLEVAS